MIVLAAVAALCGCAMNSGVVETGPNAYLVSRQAATGFSGAGTLNADAIREAGAYCAKLGKKISVTHVEEAHPAHFPGDFPRAEVQFMCLTERAPGP